MTGAAGSLDFLGYGDISSPDSEKPPAAQPHPLKVSLSMDGTEIEYDLKHPGCIGYTSFTAEIETGDDDHTYERRSFDCGVGDEIENGGFLDAIGVRSWKGLKEVTEHLEPGDYLVEYWSQRHPATPNGPEEWDCGLYVEPVPAETP